MRRCALRWLTKLEQRALGNAGSCWEDGDAIAVMEKRPDKPVAGNDGGGEWRCCCGAASDEGGGEMGK